MHVVRADIAAERGFGLRQTKTDDDQILIDDAWRGHCSEAAAYVRFAEIAAKIDATVLTEAGDRPAVGGVERIEIAENARKEDALLAVCPVAQAADGLKAKLALVKHPQLSAGCCIERDDLLCCCDGKQGVADHQRVRL